jgi:hypothetical protein
MPCAECDAFVAAYMLANERYAELVEALHEMASNGHFKDAKYPKLKAEVAGARWCR